MLWIFHEIGLVSLHKNLWSYQTPWNSWFSRASKTKDTKWEPNWLSVVLDETENHENVFEPAIEESHEIADRMIGIAPP